MFRLIRSSAFISAAFFLLLFSFSGVVSANAEERAMGDKPWPFNPVLRMFPENVLFYLSFDDGTFQPDVGRFKPVVNGGVIGEDGLFGRGLVSGQVVFQAGDALPTDTGGTVILWVQLRNKPLKQRMEPGATLFSLDLGDEGRRLLACKGHGVAYWGKENMLLMAYVPSGRQDKKLLPVSVHAQQGSTVFKDWPQDGWKMFVFTWTARKIGISIDGNTLSENLIPLPLGSPEKIRFAVNAGSPDPRNLQFSTDELVILDRVVTDSEIAALYKESLALRTRYHAKKAVQKKEAEMDDTPLELDLE